MIQPKEFYRQLDAVLAAVDQTESDSNFFLTILSILREKFGPIFSICDSYVFEKRGDDYFLIEMNVAPVDITPSDVRFPRILPAESVVVQKLVKHSSFLFNNPAHQDVMTDYVQKKQITPAGITVRGMEQQWILLFELTADWVWEEVILFLNALRTALNYRIFAESMQTEINMAVQIQKSLLPRSAPPIPGYDIHQFSQPAESVGGDFYEYFQLDEGSFGTSLGDASGHGLPAALLVRDVVIGLRMGLNKNTRIDRTLSKLNRVIQRSTYATNFVSLFIGEIQDDGHLFYINAGHPPPFILHKSSASFLDATGIALGFLPDYKWNRSHCHMKPDSILVIYSDGIIERENAQEEQFGMERLKLLVQKNTDKKAKEIVDLIFKTVFEFGGRTAWEDDATLVIIKRLEK